MGFKTTEQYRTDVCMQHDNLLEHMLDVSLGAQTALGGVVAYCYQQGVTTPQSLQLYAAQSEPLY